MRKYLLFLFMTAVLFSCKKDKQMISSPTSPQPDPQITPTVLLKDIVMPNVPSPYYHFEYDNTGKMTIAAYASDYRRYDVQYDKGHIGSMVNNIAGGLQEVLKYFYDNEGRVNAVEYFDVTGTFYAKVTLTYDGQKLIGLERQRLSGSNFFINKTMTFSYYPDGNLKEIIDHRPAIAGLQVESTTSDGFEQYDNKINVDAFSLLHNEFFDQLVLLPGVQLQKNNPAKETVTGDGMNYTGNYSYTYNGNNLPLTKTEDVTVTNGTNAGQVFQTSATFLYYQ